MATEHFNKLTEAEQERLVILAEECAEVIQAASKIKRFGLVGKPVNTTLTNKESLEMELGDVLALVDLVKASNLGITTEGIEKARLNKMQRLSKYMHTWDQYTTK